MSKERTENENASVASSSGGAMDLPLYLAVVVGGGFETRVNECFWERYVLVCVCER